MIRIKSLQQRMALFLLLPVAILLFAMISLGFFFARENLLTEWRQVLILRLGRAAHTVDMRLSHPKEWLQMYLYAAGDGYPDTVRERLVERLKEMDGVAHVNVTWSDQSIPPCSPRWPQQSFPK